jgi:hypothetical protein
VGGFPRVTRRTRNPGLIDAIPLGLFASTWPGRVPARLADSLPRLPESQLPSANLAALCVIAIRSNGWGPSESVSGSYDSPSNESVLANQSNVGAFCSIAWLAQKLDVSGRIAAAFSDRNYVVKFKIIHRTALNTSPTIAAPHFSSDLFRNRLPLVEGNLLCGFTLEPKVFERISPFSDVVANQQARFFRSEWTPNEIEYISMNDDLPFDPASKD